MYAPQVRVRRKRPQYTVELLSSVRLDRPKHDRDFLPTALEILEQPPSPVRLALMYTICACFAFALSWSFIGRMDEYATASGKVEARGRTKVLEPLRTGKVVSVHAADGTHVAVGDVLIELDRSEAEASLLSSTGELTDANAEIARRTAAIAVATARQTGKTISTRIEWPPEIPDDVRRREQAVMDADVSQLDSAVAALKAQLSQREADRDKARSSITSEEALIAVLTERVDMRSALELQKAMSRASVLDALQDLRQTQTTLVSLRGDLTGAEAAIASAEAQIQKTEQDFIASNAEGLETAYRKRGDLQQRVASAQSALADMTLLAPTTGTVQAMAVTTIGQVVSPGQELLMVVPDDAPPEIEAYMLNQDAGFVKAGQRAIIKIDAIPFTRYGTIEGEVTYVAKDAIPGLLAQQQQLDPSHSPSGALSNTSAAQRTQDLVFPIKIRPLATSLKVDGHEVPLSPGMTVNVEVQTETRRIIDYIMSPLEQIGSTALRER